ncbi:MAG: hypothetical protein ACYTGL_05880 [Planctomycetota bacterium]|jgi:hypothetical protein
MDRDPQKEFEALFEKLEPWQQQWVACRAAMRVLPAIAVNAGYKPWKEPATVFVAVAKVPWIAPLSAVCELPPDAPSYKTVFKAAQTSDSIDFKAQADVAYSAAYANANEPAGWIRAVDFAARVFDHVADAAGRAQFYVCAVEDVHFLLRHSGERLSDLVDDRIIEIEAFFCRRLWAPEDSWPSTWNDVFRTFGVGTTAFHNSYLAEFYAEHCNTGLELSAVRSWLMQEVSSPVVKLQSRKSEESTATGRLAPTACGFDESWWCRLLYRLDLDDLGRTQILTQPSVAVVDTAIRRTKSGKSAAARIVRPIKRGRLGRRSDSSKAPLSLADVVSIAKWLEKKYGHMSEPPPLWRAWFQAVHGEKLRKIQEHFARGAE